mmetsp:Transcript_12747/g.28590  ORF Transcript_12747/g.28590 Transcript_12747/m.28590 type:complete len:93 (+) Transcript_12747:969-1247(+)
MKSAMRYSAPAMAATMMGRPTRLHMPQPIWASLLMDTPRTVCDWTEESMDSTTKTTTKLTTPITMTPVDKLLPKKSDEGATPSSFNFEVGSI